jgi:shikimate dehydrogenase
MSESDRYAVMGYPISHSKSPFIHAAFAQQTGQPIQYTAIEVLPGQFVQAVRTFRCEGGKGLNVTVPFKQAAYELADIRSTRAEQAGAVNTLWFNPEGQCIGDNTDGVGLVRDLLKNYHGRIEERRILILGAGGAVRGVLELLLTAKPECCVIANRTVAKAQTLTDLFSRFGNVTASSYEGLINQSFDLIINGTSASLKGELPPVPKGVLIRGGWCYDMMYSNTMTPFMEWALAQGAAMVVDGLGMLVEQAAEAFYIWRGIMPNTASVIQQLRTKQSGHSLPIRLSSAEIGGPAGLEPTRYGDWEKKGRCIDF